MVCKLLINSPIVACSSLKQLCTSSDSIVTLLVVNRSAWEENYNTVMVLFNILHKINLGFRNFWAENDGRFYLVSNIDQPPSENMSGGVLWCCIKTLNILQKRESLKLTHKKKLSETDQPPLDSMSGGHKCSLSNFE